MPTTGHDDCDASLDGARLGGGEPESEGRDLCCFAIPASYHHGESTACVTERTPCGPLSVVLTMDMPRSGDPLDWYSLSARAEQALFHQQALRRTLAANTERLVQTRTRIARTMWSETSPLLPQRRPEADIVTEAQPPPAMERAHPNELAGLTKREVDVLRLIAKGRSTKELAFELNITFKTAACHRFNLMRKLKVREVASMVRIAIRNGLVRP